MDEITIGMAIINNLHNSTISEDNKNIRNKILETFQNIIKKQNQLELMINNFFERYQDIENDENDFYLKSDNLNDIKTFVKGQILTHYLCDELYKNNINTFTVEDLNRYIILYEENKRVDLDSFKRGVDVYSQLEKIYEFITDEKNMIYSNFFQDFLNISISSIDNIKLYLSNNGQEVMKILKEKAMEGILDEFTYNCCLGLLNVFYSLLEYEN